MVYLGCINKKYLAVRTGSETVYNRCYALVRMRIEREVIFNFLYESNYRYQLIVCNCSSSKIKTT